MVDPNKHIENIVMLSVVSHTHKLWYVTRDWRVLSPDHTSDITHHIWRQIKVSSRTASARAHLKTAGSNVPHIYCLSDHKFNNRKKKRERIVYEIEASAMETLVRWRRRQQQNDEHLPNQNGRTHALCIHFISSFFSLSCCSSFGSGWSRCVLYTLGPQCVYTQSVPTQKQNLLQPAETAVAQMKINMNLYIFNIPNWYSVAFPLDKIISSVCLIALDMSSFHFK